MSQNNQVSESWSALQGLAEQYHKLVQEGASQNIDERSPEQIEIANEIVTRTYPYIKKIAEEVTSPKKAGHVLRVNGQERRLRFTGGSTPLQDLVHEAQIAVLESLGRYNPEKGAITTFISSQVAGTVYRSALEDAGLLRLPQSIIQEAKSLVDFSSSRYEAIKKIMKKIQVSPEGESRKKPVNLAIASAIYSGFTRKRIDINMRLSEGIGSSPANDTFEGRYLVDESSLTKDEIIQILELEELVDEALGKLKPREEQVLRCYFGIDEQEPLTLDQTAEYLDTHMGSKIGRERVRQIKEKALEKLSRFNWGPYGSTFNRNGSSSNLTLEEKMFQESLEYIQMALEEGNDTVSKIADSTGYQPKEVRTILRRARIPLNSLKTRKKSLQQQKPNRIPKEERLAMVEQAVNDGVFNIKEISVYIGVASATVSSDLRRLGINLEEKQKEWGSLNSLASYVWNEGYFSAIANGKEVSYKELADGLMELMSIDDNYQGNHTPRETEDIIERLQDLGKITEIDNDCFGLKSEVYETLTAFSKAYYPDCSIRDLEVENPALYSRLHRFSLTHVLPKESGTEEPLSFSEPDYRGVCRRDYFDKNPELYERVFDTSLRKIIPKELVNLIAEERAKLSEPKGETILNPGFWTEDDVGYLKLSYMDEDLMELSQSLGRTPGSVMGRLNTLSRQSEEKIDKTRVSELRREYALFRKEK